MNGIDLFKYDDHDVRALVIDGEPWFVLRDVCNVLAIAQPIRVAEALDDDEVTTTHVTDSLGRQQLTYIVSESGLYSLILRSRKPEAKAFKRWITHDVLPAIRKTGSYALNPAPVFQIPQTYAAALELAAAQARELEEKQAELAIAAPKADAFDSFLSASGDYSVRDAVKVLNRDHAIAIREKALYAWLNENRWIYRDSGRNWCGYADPLAAGYVAHKAQWHHHPFTGEKVIDPPQLRITAKGIERLSDRLRRAA